MVSLLDLSIGVILFVILFYFYITPRWVIRILRKKGFKDSDIFCFLDSRNIPIPKKFKEENITPRWVIRILRKKGFKDSDIFCFLDSRISQSQKNSRRKNNERKN